MKQTTIWSSKLLLVEGKDECHFFKALLKSMNIEHIQCQDIGGVSKFKTELNLVRATQGFEDVTHIGLVRDAEKHAAQSAFQSICSILEECGFPVLKSLDDPFACSDKLRIGLFIMPDNQQKGMLEDLCLQSIAGTDEERCIEAFIECSQQTLAKEDKEKFNSAKARVQSYLACQVPLVNSLGLGAQKHHWDFSKPCFNKIKEFLLKSFEPKFGS